MSKQPIHRHTANSKAGRRIAAASSSLNMGSVSTLTKEQRDWNARVEEQKKAKKAARHGC
jgi:hypothetical protein